MKKISWKRIPRKYKICLILAPFAWLMKFNSEKINDFIHGNARKETMESSFSGRLDSTYNDKYNRYIYVIKINNAATVELKADSWTWSRDFAEIGDSIIKPAASLFFIVKKSDGQSKTFFYLFDI